MTYTVEELALAYELRQEGCCWKRIAQGLGGDAIALSAAVSHCVQLGVTKWMNGYARQPGRPPVMHMDIIKAAHNMKTNSRMTWRAIGQYLDVDHEPLRRAHYHAVTAGLLK